MRRRSAVRIRLADASIALLALGTGLSVAGSAGAVGHPPSSVQPGQLPGYSVVHSPPVQVAAGSWALGKVKCPTGTVAVDGGPHGPEVSPPYEESINSSYPDLKTRSWVVVVTDASTQPTSFVVWAICLSATGARVASSPVTTPAGTDENYDVVCPGRDLALGAGAAASSVSPSYAINAMQANLVNWTTVGMSNSNDAPESATLYTVCYPFTRLPSLQDVNTTGQITVGQRVELAASCPVHTHVVWGGAATDIFKEPTPGNAGLTMMSSVPLAGVNGTRGWDVSWGNGSSYDATIATRAICG
jgi:hypothetical protein